MRNNLTGVPDQPNGSATRAIPSAKANLILGPWYETEFFANFGTGFHSNDARAVVQDSTLPALAQATGWEFGTRTRDPAPRRGGLRTTGGSTCRASWSSSATRARTEPSGPSHRQGFEFSLKAKLLDWLTFTGNVTKTPAEFFNGNAVPLAPRLTAFADLTARLPWGLSASATMRYVGDRYADEERTQTARGYTLFDVGARYRYKLPAPSPSTPS